MSDIPLPIIGIVLAIGGFILTRILTPKRRPLSAMRPEFERTTLDEEELGNEAMDMDIVRRAEAKNQRLANAYRARWAGRAASGTAHKTHLGDRK